MPFPLDVPESELRRRRSQKWVAYPEDVLPQVQLALVDEGGTVGVGVFEVAQPVLLVPAERVGRGGAEALRAE